MASPALARESDRERPERYRRDWLPLILALVVQLATIAFFYGRLTDRVDAIGQDVQMLKLAIIQNQFKR